MAYESNITVIDHQRIWADVTEKLREFRHDMFRNINYVNGIQYTADDLKYLAHHKRLPVVWNIVLPKILAFTGAERSNRMMTRAEAVEPSDVDMAEIINLLLEQDNQETRTAWNISLAAMHAAIFRYGALMATWEKTNKYPEGQYVVRALDPRDVWFDPNPSEMDFDNSNYIIYSRWYTPEHIIQKYASHDPQFAKELEAEAARLEGLKSGKLSEKTYAERLRSFTSDGFKGDKTKYSNDFPYSDYSDYRYNGMYRVIELHQREKVDTLYVIDPIRGENIKIPQALNQDQEFINAELMKRGLDRRALSWKKDDLMTISVSAPGLSNKILYKKPYAVQGAGYMIKIIPGYNLDPDRRNLRSIVDVLIDPQDLINRDLSSRAHMMNKLLNPDIYLGPQALDDERQISQIQSQAHGKIVHMNNIHDMRIEYPDLGAMNMFTQSARDAQAMSEETPGISKNMMGMKEHSDESGKLVQVRAGLSEAMLTLLFDNVSNAIKSLEEYHLATLQRHMTLRRMIRTVGPNGEVKYIGYINDYDAKLNIFKNDITVGKFDIRLDTTKYTRSERQLQLDKLIQLLQMADPESRIDMYPQIFDLLDTPQGQALSMKANERSELMKMRRNLESMGMLAQLAQLQTQLNLQSEMDQVQALNVISQKLQAILTNNQLNQALGAQQAGQEMSAGAGAPMPTEAPPAEAPPSATAPPAATPTEDELTQDIEARRTEGPAL